MNQVREFLLCYQAFYCRIRGFLVYVLFSMPVVFSDCVRIGGSPNLQLQQSNLSYKYKRENNVLSVKANIQAPDT